MNYKVGIIGCGRIGSLFEEDPKIKKKPCTHAGAYSKFENIKITSACDIKQDRLEKFSKTWDVKNGSFVKKVVSSFTSIIGLEPF